MADDTLVLSNLLCFLSSKYGKCTAQSMGNVRLKVWECTAQSMGNVRLKVWECTAKVLKSALIDLQRQGYNCCKSLFVK